jgi:transposase
VFSTLELLFPHLSGLLLEEVAVEAEQIVVQARVRATSARCRRCGRESGQVHGWYERRLRDGAVAGVAVLIRIRVRRFRCSNNDCSAKTFAEQVEGLTSPHSRFTPTLRQWLTKIAVALAGRPGERLAESLGVLVGRDTLLRLIKALPDPPAGAVTVLGVDDFAFRKGRHYGTILIDLLERRVLDLFDGRDGATLAAWLADHPQVEVICRDRAGAYADGARTGAGQAVQVADRFHLWQNLADAVEKTVNAHRAGLILDNLTGALPAEPTAEPVSPSGEAPDVVRPIPEKRIVTRLREQHAAVARLWQQGLSKAAIGRELGLHQATVRKLVNATVDDLITKTEQRAHLVDAYVPHLHQRWNEGERNATALFREITARGYPGGELAVQRYLRRFRDGRGHAPLPKSKPLPVRKVTSWIMTHPDHLKTKDSELLEIIRTGTDSLDRLAKHVRDFAVMITTRRGIGIDAWITQIEADTLAPLTSFASHLRHDLDAVRNGLTLPHNSGAVEGTINRLKMLKRQMFGRASLELLRKRMIHKH